MACYQVNLIVFLTYLVSCQVRCDPPGCRSEDVVVWQTELVETQVEECSTNEEEKCDDCEFEVKLECRNYYVTECVNSSEVLCDRMYTDIHFCEEVPKEECQEVLKQECVNVTVEKGCNDQQKLCKRLPVKTCKNVTLNIPATVGRNVSYMICDNSCENKYENENYKGQVSENCSEIFENVCKEIFEEECFPDEHELCETVYETECVNKTEILCQRSFIDIHFCDQIPREECQDVPKKICQNVPSGTISCRTSTYINCTLEPIGNCGDLLLNTNEKQYNMFCQIKNIDDKEEIIIEENVQETTGAKEDMEKDMVNTTDDSNMEVITTTSIPSTPDGNIGEENGDCLGSLKVEEKSGKVHIYTKEINNLNIRVKSLFLEGCGCFRAFERKHGGGKSYYINRRGTHYEQDMNLSRVKSIRRVPCVFGRTQGD